MLNVNELISSIKKTSVNMEHPTGKIIKANGGLPPMLPDIFVQ